MVRRCIMLSRKKRRNERFYEQQVSSLFFYQEVFFFVTQPIPILPSLSLTSHFYSPPFMHIKTSFFFSVLSLFATAGYLLVTPLTLLPLLLFSRGITVRRYLASPPAT